MIAIQSEKVYFCTGGPAREQRRAKDGTARQTASLGVLPTLPGHVIIVLRCAPPMTRIQIDQIYCGKEGRPMKKILSLLLALAMLLSATGALALNYTGRQGNEATFETLEEARVSGPLAVQDLETNGTKTFISSPVLDGYPEGTFVYRSANLYGGRASARQNTNIVVYADQNFEDKADAKAYLEELGLIKIIDEAIGSIVLVTPTATKGSSGVTYGYTKADQQNYYKLQTAMLSQKATSTNAEGQSVSWCDAEYFGGYSFFYVIGIGIGATFLNNYVAPVLDYVSRIGGLLLINGTMERIREVADEVPAYLVNADAATIAKYEAANGTDLVRLENGKKITFNHEFPVRRVVTVEAAEVDLPALIEDAYYNFFIKAQRSQTLSTGGPTSASSPWQGYAQDSAPYSLEPRNAIINGRTLDGINLAEFHEDRFNVEGAVTPDGEYLETWYEYMPDEVLDGTAPEHSIPLLVLQHGGGDDPRLYVEEQGYLKLMGERRIAAIAPEHQYITDFIPEATTLLVKYILDKFPALDPARVYVTGYSMGGWATYSSVNGDASLYAAGFAQAIIARAITDEQKAQYEYLDMPMMCSTSEYDYFVDAATHNLGASYLGQLNEFMGYNGIKPLEGEQDFDKYPILGYPADIYETRILNGEYLNHTWLFLNDKGVPMNGVNYTECNTHALYAEYANVVWDFFKHYSRDPETKEIIYNPYAF